MADLLFVHGMGRTRGVSGRWSPFGGEANDGVVSVGETRADWLHESVSLPVIHTWLPASGQVAETVLARLDRLGLLGSI